MRGSPFISMTFGLRGGLIALFALGIQAKLIQQMVADVVTDTQQHTTTHNHRHRPRKCSQIAI